MRENIPLYNSRITRLYCDYIEKHNPEIIIEDLLQYAEITRHELEDQGHWFTQRQINRFQEILIARTGENEIARKVGRYAAFSPVTSGVVKPYIMGFLSLASVYKSINFSYKLLSKGAVLETHSLTSNKVKIIVTPKPGVSERPHLCLNRIGTFESFGKWFTKEYSTIEHPQCFHRGDSSCHYLVSWEEPKSVFWKRMRNYSQLFSVAILTALFFIIPFQDWLLSSLIAACLCVAAYARGEHLEKKEHLNIVENRGNAAKDLLDEINIRYNNAVLVQEVGKETSSLADANKIAERVLKAIEKHHNFAKGFVLLADTQDKPLQLEAGYGFTQEQRALLEGSLLNTVGPSGTNLFMSVFLDQKPFLLNETDNLDNILPDKKIRLFKQLAIRSVICVPLIYQKQSLGILAVANPSTNRPLAQSDISLLTGIASQTSVSIVNARAFTKLQESEERHRLFVETILDVVYTINQNGHFTYLSPMIEQITGYSPIDLIGRHFSEIILPDQHSKLQTILQDSLLNERSRSETAQIKAKDGSIVTVEFNLSTLYDSKGEAIGGIGVARDITLRVQEEEKRKEMEMKALSQSKLASLGEIATGIAHEINQPLSYIRIVYEAALKDINNGQLNPDEVGEDFTEALRQVSRISKIIDHLRLFGRADTTSFTPLQLENILDNTLILMGERLRINNITLEREIQESIPTIQGNSSQLEQVFINLFQNSIDVLQDREDARISVDIKNGHDSITVLFSDNGPGIDKDLQEKIFEPFFTTKEVGKGTGLGLAIIYGIISDHNGTITCDSASGQGTSFIITLPNFDKRKIPPCRK